MPQTSVGTLYPVAFVGMEPDGAKSQDEYTSRVSTETTLQIPFGTVVKDDASNKGVGCKVLAAQADLPLGIVPYKADYQIDHELATVADSNGNIGLKGGTQILIKRRGRLWVQIETDCADGDAVRYRVNNASTGVGPGSFTKTSSAGNTVDISKFARWVGTNLAANGWGLLEYDFTMQSNKSSD
jgi:hypothetical protein